uniref:Trans-1,2-dihydrobenzene-1,2-diol dehydrogenase n=1 Tax=Laticauda laticaudata TaxID=8630 RepID=A0A8C5RWU7_LATLA
MRLCWGICSAGKISHDFIVALKTLPADHKIVAIASSKLERAQEYARLHGICRAYGSYEELAKDPEVDVIYVGSLNTQHLGQTTLFLRAKKNVLCEKPMGMNAREVQEMIRTARENDVFLMEGFWTRFFPVSEQIRDALCQKSLGNLKVLRAQMAVRMDDIPRLLEKKLGGGVILDLGGYCIQFASMVFGPEMPQSIVASGLLNKTGVDETVSIILNYSANRQAVLNITMMIDLPGEATIGGTGGIIKIPDNMNSPTVMFLKGNRWEWPLPPSPERLYFKHNIGFRYQIEHVRECLENGLKESPIMPLEESERIVCIMDEARKQVGVVYEQDRNM